jgi:signal transduction histidine kinase
MQFAYWDRFSIHYMTKKLYYNFASLIIVNGKHLISKIKCIKEWLVVHICAEMPNTQVNILVVDDDARNLQVLESILASPLISIVRATNAQEALLALVEGEFAAIVLDVRLPDMTGIELAKLVKQRKRTQHIPILFLTAFYLDEDDILEGYRAGAVDYLTKPVNPYILKSKIWVYVDLFRANRELIRLNQTLQTAEQAMAKANSELEMRVQERTEELTLANRAKDDFLAVLSHELRMPLNPALLLASEAADDPQVPKELRERFNAIAGHILLEARLIDDLLDLTRVSRGKLSLEKKPVDIHLAFKEALGTVQEEVQKKELRLECHLLAGQFMVLGDFVRLQQVFWNVLKNAVKFTSSGGRVKIETSLDSNQIVFHVTDTGIGMSPKEIDCAFNAFAQGEHSQSKSHRFGGLGLGLSITKRLVELHAGNIQAESPGRDKGTTLTIKLPLARTAVNAVDVSNSSNGSPVKHLRILLVEDHESTRLTLIDLLKRREHLVTAAGSVDEARRISKREKFDLVLSDIGLPDGNGYALMAELKQNYGLPGIALTGYGMEQDIEKAKNAGFTVHLTKPIHVDLLEKALQTFTENKPNL